MTFEEHIRTARDRGLKRALEIQIHEPIDKWRAFAEEIVDEEERAIAVEYLRGIVERTNTARKVSK